MTKSKTFFWLSIALICGIALASWPSVSWFITYLILLAGLAALIINWSNKEIRIIAMGGLFLFLGIIRFNLSMPIFQQNDLAFYNEQTISFIGVIKTEPDVRSDQTKLTIDVEQISVAGQSQSASGRVLVTTDLYPEYNYGDQLKITCFLQTPGQIDDFAYDEYLAVKRIYSLCYYPKEIGLIKSKQGNPIYQFILGVKDRLQLVINQSLIEPAAGLLSAIILGNRRNISPELLDQFNQAGVSHIIAISGLHITVIAGLLMNLGILLYLGRRRAFYLAIIFLTLFILMIGARASAIRAGIMGLTALLAMQVGRLSKPLNLLLLAAGVMLMINPLLLKSDVGFQLSFLAVSGIIYFQPMLAKIKSQWRDKWQIRNSLEMTLSAQVMVLPLLIYQFHRLSLIAPIANVLILPLLPFLMLLGLLVSLWGLFYLPLAQILFWPVWLMLAYIVGVVSILVKLPGSSLAVSFPIWLVIIIYLGIGYIIYKFRNK